MKTNEQVGNEMITFDDRPRKIAGATIQPRWAWSADYAKSVVAGFKKDSNSASKAEQRGLNYCHDLAKRRYEQNPDAAAKSGRQLYQEMRGEY